MVKVSSGLLSFPAEGVLVAQTLRSGYVVGPIEFFPALPAMPGWQALRLGGSPATPDAAPVQPQPLLYAANPAATRGVEGVSCRSIRQGLRASS